MALRPTIYKLKIALSDLNRHHYDELNLTVACHPSETTKRMMVRVLAYCLNARDNLLFGKGISSPEEPDLWAKTMDDRIELWVEVGEPAFDRIKKATRISLETKVYCFNSKASAWWEQLEPQLKNLKVEVMRFDRKGLAALDALVERTVDLSVTISDNSIFVAGEGGEAEVLWEVLRA